jgi:cytidine deaminase
MSTDRHPFLPDPAVADRRARAEARVGGPLVARIGALAAERNGPDAGDAGVLLAAEAADLVAAFDLAGPDDLMCLALPHAASLARPAISGFVVGAVGLEAGTGNLLLGGNVEFPGASLGLTLHGEGAVTLRAFGRGTAVEALAVIRARPCAHCRQVLTELAWADDLVLIDPAGHRVTLDDLYPWPFSPGALGTTGAVPGAVPWPDLALASDAAPQPVVERLVRAGSRAHAPYTRSPAAAVLALPDGGFVVGSALESVAYNPSIGPVQAAVPELLARGWELADVRAAWVAVPAEAPVDHAAVARHLLRAIAPSAPVTVVHWS